MSPLSQYFPSARDLLWKCGHLVKEEWNNTTILMPQPSTRVLLLAKSLQKVHNTWPKGKPLYENWRAMPANYAVQAVNKRRQISNMAGVVMEAIEGLCFLAPLPVTSTGWTEGGEKTQPFNCFHSRLFTYVIPPSLFSKGPLT